MSIFLPSNAVYYSQILPSIVNESLQTFWISNFTLLLYGYREQRLQFLKSNLHYPRYVGHLDFCIKSLECYIIEIGNLQF